MANNKSEFVTVACRLPSGHVLRFFRMISATEATPQGTREYQRAEEIADKRITLNGWNSGKAFTRNPRTGLITPGQISKGGGVGLTPGIKREDFEEWLRANADSPLVQNRVIFAHDDTAGMAAEYEQNGDRSGLEPWIPADVARDGTILQRDPRDKGMSLYGQIVQTDGDRMGPG
jgi:hypothetical protein